MPTARHVLLGVVLLLAGACGDGSSSEQVVANAGTTAQPPLVPRLLPAIAMDETHAIVFGGQEAGRHGRLLSDGAILELSSGDWSALPPSTFGGPLYSPSAVVADDGFLIIGVRCDTELAPAESVRQCQPGSYEAALYSTAEEAWERVAPPPEATGGDGLSGGALPVGMTNRGAVFVAGGAQPWRFNPATGWETLPAAPLQAQRYCASDSGLLALEYVGSAALNLGSDLAPGQSQVIEPAGEAPIVAPRASLLSRSEWTEPKTLPADLNPFGSTMPTAFDAGCTDTGAVVFVPAVDQHTGAVEFNGEQSSWGVVDNPPEELHVSAPAVPTPGGATFMTLTGALSFDHAVGWGEPVDLGGLVPNVAASNNAGQVLVGSRSADGSATVFRLITTGS